MILLLLVSHCPHVQAEQLPIRTFTSADGLAHDLIHAIVADSHGFLWFCTADGLSRFDGVLFTTYAVKDGLAFPHVNHLLESRAGVYWIATNGGGVSRFDPASKSSMRFSSSSTGGNRSMFTTYLIGDDEPSNRVNKLHEDREGRIWAGTDGGLFYLTPDEASVDGKVGNKFRRVEFGLGSLPERGIEVPAMVEDGEGCLWIGTSKGVVRRLPDGRMIQYHFQSTQKSITSNASTEEEYVWALLADRENRLWVSARSGLYLVKPESVARAVEEAEAEHWWRVSEIDNDRAKRRLDAVPMPVASGEAYRLTIADGLAGEDSRALFQANDGHVWLGAQVGGLTEFDGNRFSKFTSAQGINDKILTLAEDRNGSIWVGTQTSGATKLSHNGWLSYRVADGLGTSDIIGIFETLRGELCVISRGGFINRFDGKVFTALHPNIPPHLLNSATRALPIMQDHAGGWWMATPEGLYLFAPVERIEQLARAAPQAHYTIADGMADNIVSRIFEDSHGDVWIGSYNPPVMLTRWERATNTFHRYAEADGLPAFNWANVFREDGAGNLWIGLHNGGLTRRRNERFEFFGDADGAPQGLVQGLYFDRSNRLWAATGGKGIWRYDAPTNEHPRAATYTTLQDLASDTIWCFTEDQWGRIYIGTARGIDRLDPATNALKHFSLADGLIKSEVLVAFRDRQQRLWFGTHDGVSVFTPQLANPRPPAPALISSLSIAGRQYPISEIGETSPAELVLEANQNQLELGFFAVGSFGDAFRYKYMLEGADHEWSTLTDNRSVTYANLAPGAYRFLVQAVNADGLSNPQPASFRFTILAPIWRRWWFVTLMVLMLAALVHTRYRFRLRRLLELERVRTRIATDLHDDIGASLSQVAILSEIVNQQVGEQSPLNESLTVITGTSREMVDSMSDIVWAINPQRDHLSDLTQRMRRFAGDTFNVRDIEMSFQARGMERDVPMGAELRREVYLIFKETINNTIKHSACTEVKIEFEIEGEWLTVKVCDNGTGFDVTAAIDSRRAGMGGHGLTSMRRRAASFGGTYDIESAKGHGTNVTLKIPLQGGARRLTDFLRSRLSRTLPK